MTSRSDDAEQIRTLLSRVAHLADEGTPEQYRTVFTPDAVWVMPANPATGVAANTRKGADDIIAGLAERQGRGIQGPGSASRHIVSTIAIDFEDDDTANTVSYWQFFNDTTTAPRVVSMGRYDTTLRRYEGEWRVSYRSITLG
jgi:3-phenylpropionate/cinnamic acid dioxygenase small subunit